jgi:hypothetical protein
MLCVGLAIPYVMSFSLGSVRKRMESGGVIFNLYGLCSFPLLQAYLGTKTTPTNKEQHFCGLGRGLTP